MTKWIRVEDHIPNTEDDVLVVMGENIVIVHLRWYYPTHEDSYEAFQYWSDNDGAMVIDWHEVTHWMPLPELPNEQE